MEICIIRCAGLCVFHVGRENEWLDVVEVWACLRQRVGKNSVGVCWMVKGLPQLSHLVGSLIGIVP